MKLFLNNILLILTSSIAIESVVSQTFKTTPECKSKCPVEPPGWQNGDQCNVREIGPCMCTYPEHQECFLECLTNNDAAETGTWAMACAGGQIDPSEETNTSLTASPTVVPPTFVTSPECESKCPVEPPTNGDQCSVAEISSCLCTYNDPFCHLECADDNNGTKTGTWLMLCAEENVLTPPPSASQTASPTVVPPTFITSPECEPKCPVKHPEIGAQCSVAEIGSCLCTYDDPECFLECADNNDGTETWLMGCAEENEVTPPPSASQTASPTVVPPTFVTSPECEPKCPVEPPEIGAQCSVAEIGSCLCTYDDPECFLECADNNDGTETWLMGCAEEVTPPPSANPTGSPIATPKAVCRDNPGFRFKKDRTKSCIWIGSQETRRENLCKKSGVRSKCKITCGICCADDLTRTFQTGPKGNKKERDCVYLSVEKFPSPKINQCPRTNVNAMCAESCGRCCKNIPKFNFQDDQGKTRKCQWVKKNKNRITKWCNNSAVSEGCASVCKSCRNYTVRATPSPTKSQVKAPVAAPVAAPTAPTDDD